MRRKKQTLILEFQMAHNVKSMFSMLEKPWHGLGKVLTTPPATVAEAIQVAGIDPEIQTEPLYLANGTKVERNAVTSKATGFVYGTVGPDWQAIQPAEAFAPCQPFLDAKAATIETAGALDEGRRVWMLLKLNKPDSVIVPQADDRVQKYLLAAVGHDGTLAFRLGMTAIRVVCQNTLSASIKSGESDHVRITHRTRNAAQAIEAVTATIQAVDARFEKAAEVFRALATIKIQSAKQLEAYITAVFGIKTKDKANAIETSTGRKAESFADLLSGSASLSGHTAVHAAKYGDVEKMAEAATSRVLENVSHLFESGRGQREQGIRGTGWAAYNAVTEYCTWERGHNADNRLNNVWLNKTGPVANALPMAVEHFLEGKTA
jgi:phage/plasmid-like protein (TIGR03299 family)